MQNIRIALPQNVEDIIRKINSHGFLAYAVGGCIRDSILGRTPYDWDIATSAKSEQIKCLFEKTVDTGIKHGTVSVLIGKSHYEVTTFRTDGVYLDNRHPENVTFSTSITDDLSRRDFTMNAIAYHPQEGLVDPFQGIADIKAKVIRTVGDSMRRFNEDALRMLRAVRFSVQLGFEIEEKTKQAIMKNSALIQNISMERIREEITKILLSDDVMRMSMLKNTGLMQYLLPEFLPCYETEQHNPHHIYNVAEHCLQSVRFVEKDPILRWTMFLHDIGKSVTRTTDGKEIDHFYGHPHKSEKIAEAILTKLRFDHRTKHKILTLILHHDMKVEPTPKAVKKAILLLGEENFIELLKVWEADKRAQSQVFLEDWLLHIAQVKGIYEEIKEKKDCLILKQLALNGDDLIVLGYSEGKEIGMILNKLLEVVIENPEFNTREKLQELLEK